MRAEDLADVAVDRLRRDILRTAAALLRWLRDAAADATELDRTIGAKLGTDLGARLGELGFDEAADRVITTFEAIAVGIQADLRASLGVRSATVPLSHLRPFVTRVAKALVTQKGVAGERARLALMRLVGTNAPVADALQEVAEEARKGLSAIVVDVATSLHAFLREGLISQAHEAGIDLFRYGGPDDEITRPFCVEHLDRVYTAKDLDEEDNGQGLEPTSRFLGGYNCRHRLEPMSVEAARELPRRMIGGREARAIVMGRAVGSAERAWLSKYRGRTVGGLVVRARAR